MTIVVEFVMTPSVGFSKKKKKIVMTPSVHNPIFCLKGVSLIERENLENPNLSQEVNRKLETCTITPKR